MHCNTRPARVISVARAALLFRTSVIAWLACGLSSVGLAQPGDLEAITKAAVIYNDPVDIDSVVTVCGRCHAAAMYLTVPRSYTRWEEVFARMSKHGATGSDDQLRGVIRFFDRNLTVVNLNTSPAVELEAALQIDEMSSSKLMQLRQSRKLSTIADLKGIDGLTPKRLAAMESLGLIQF